MNVPNAGTTKMMTPESTVCKEILETKTPSICREVITNISPVNVKTQVYDDQMSSSDVNTLLDRETQTVVPQYIDENSNVTPRIRAMLVDWIASVSTELGFTRETFHTSITIMDKYLSMYPETEKECLQIVGASSLSISAKIIETKMQGCSLFSQCTANTCTCQEIFEYEKKILMALDCRIPVSPIPELFSYYLDLLLSYRQLLHDVTPDSPGIPINRNELYFKCIDLYDRLLLDYRINDFRLTSNFRGLPNVSSLSADCQKWVLSIAQSAPAHPYMQESIGEQEDEQQRENHLYYLTILQTHNNFSFDDFISLEDDEASVTDNE
ncbi:hypothetical protein WA158_008176 [Blastocystis sp. Blastoise]